MMRPDECVLGELTNGSITFTNFSRISINPLVGSTTVTIPQNGSSLVLAEGQILELNSFNKGTHTPVTLSTTGETQYAYYI